LSCFETARNILEFFDGVSWRIAIDATFPPKRYFGWRHDCVSTTYW